MRYMRINCEDEPECSFGAQTGRAWASESWMEALYLFEVAKFRVISSEDAAVNPYLRRIGAVTLPEQ